MQEVEITVKGGYAPSLIRVQAGVPLRLIFDRQETGECTSRVVFPDFKVNRSLVPFTRTTVDLLPERSGEFGFACGMNMVHGTLLVEAGTDGDEVGGGTRVELMPRPSQLPERPVPKSALGDEQDAEERARQDEIRDLTRRVIVGAVLTIPILAASMAHDLFDAMWVPGVLLNPWVQLAMITPVMFYAGWPVHQIGWLIVRRRASDMNTLIAIGTAAAYGFSLVVTVAPQLLPPDLRQVYYEAVGTILTLIILGRLLEA
ncbi:MAG: cupredoxin domain-containing protein, partial [Actinomycetota bacterium]